MGGTFAYWKWTTNESQRTEVVFTIEEDFRCSADGGGNITSNDITLAPADCTNSNFAIQREIEVTPTIFGDNPIRMDLWLDINNLGNGLSNSNNFKYALTTEENSCTSGVIKTGNFNGKSQGDKVPLFNYMGYTASTEETYYLYVWLDKEENSTSTMNQLFDLSINGICTDAPEPQTYVVFNETDTTLRLYKRDENTSQINNTINNYSISRLDNNIQTIEEQTISEEDKIYFDLENTVYSSASQLPWYEYRDSITRIVIEDEISPISTAYWFSNLLNVVYINVSNLDTSNVTNMENMFYSTGKNVTGSFEIVGLDKWDTSNVTFIDGMFQYAATNSSMVSIYNLADWDVSNVTSMAAMFMSFASHSSELNLDLSKWNTSKVTNISHMFHSFGSYGTTINIGDLSTKRVVKSDGTEYIAWDVSNVEDMRYTFCYLGYKANIFNIGNLNDWNVSKVTDMGHMFHYAGRTATMFNIGDISGWDVSNVTDTEQMFNSTGINASNWSLDLSGWDVSNVTIYDNFLNRNTDKITPPIWNTSS